MRYAQLEEDKEFGDDDNWGLHQDTSVSNFAMNNFNLNSRGSENSPLSIIQTDGEPIGGVHSALRIDLKLIDKGNTSSFINNTCGPFRFSPRTKIKELV